MPVVDDEDEPKPETPVELCIGCGEQEATGAYWNDMRLCPWCYSDFDKSPEYEAAHAEARKLVGADKTIPIYQRAARAWLGRQRKAFGLSIPEAA